MDRQQTNIYRGIATLVIVLSHVMGTFGNGVRVFTPLGGIGVSVFLLLSAYGLNEQWNTVYLSIPRRQRIKKWWKKRFVSVWIPYMGIQLVAYWPFHKFNIWEFVQDLLLIKPLHPLGWYLQYLFMWYVVFFAVRQIREIDQYREMIFVLVAIITFIMLSEIKAEQSMSFPMGIILSERVKIKDKLFSIRYGLTSLVVGILFLAMKQTPKIRSANEIIMKGVQLGIKLPCGLGLMIIWYVLSKKYRLQKTQAFIGGVGLISYEIYLIHGYILQLVPHNSFGLCIFVLGTIILSIVYWMCFKRIRSMIKMYSIR